MQIQGKEGEWKMDFFDVEHKDKHWELIVKAGASDSENDFKAAIFLLSSPILARKCPKYVEHKGIKFTELKKAAKPWSSSEKALVNLAAALFNSSW